MEKWKIATIAALLVALLGLGIAQQNADKKRLINPNQIAAGPPLPSPYLGKNLPPWNFKEWNSKPVSLSALEGKPALIEIFRTECSHCNEAAPYTVAIDKRYGPRGLQMLAIQSPGDFQNPGNPENSWPAVQGWLKSKKITYPVAFDRGSTYFQGTIQKQVLGDDPSKLLYPTLLLIDKNGKVDFAQTGHDQTKAIALAVELEKRFPGSPDTAKNADSLVKWLQQNLPQLQVSGNLLKALRDDIAQRLKSP